jgi:hypothetical protein
LSNGNHFPVDHYFRPYQTPKNTETIFQKSFYAVTNEALIHLIFFFSCPSVRHITSVTLGQPKIFILWNQIINKGQIWFLSLKYIHIVSLIIIFQKKKMKNQRRLWSWPNWKIEEIELNCCLNWKIVRASGSQKWHQSFSNSEVCFLSDNMCFPHCLTPMNYFSVS